MQSGNWHDLIKVKDLYTGDVTPVVFNDLSLAVYDGKSGITVSAALCTHAGANLCDGYFDGQFIECPLHQGLFDAKSGEAKAAPVVRALKMYECRILEDTVQIMLP